MHACDILAYAYDADMHCPDCARHRFGAALNKRDTVDSEGNPLSVLFASNAEQPETCGDCGQTIDGTEE